MLGAARWSLVPALVAAWLLLPATASAIVPQVHDGGKFFKEETIKKADTILLDIQRKHKKDVVVETFEKIPDDVLKGIKYDPKNLNSFFDQWAKKLAESGKVNGIVILIAKNQNNDNKTRIQEEIGEQTRVLAFKPTDREDLHNIFVNNWQKDHDAALLEGLAFIDSRMAAHHKTAGKEGAAVIAQAPTRTKTSSTVVDSDKGSNILAWVCIGFCVLVGIWLIVGLFRAFSGGGGGGYAGGPGYGGGYGGGGGGGFMTGLMGGLFGAMAGSWLYNNMFGGSSHHGGGWESSANAGQTSTGDKDDFGPSDQGQGFSGGGGDVDGGGGDVDSGDAGGGGGGDWGGGGDAGGGGGDWGGGGGDWGGGGGGDFGGGGGGGDW